MNNVGKRNIFIDQTLLQRRGMLSTINFTSNRALKYGKNFEDSIIGMAGAWSEGSSVKSEDEAGLLYVYRKDRYTH